MAGDTALKKLATALTTKAFQREVDYIFRLGGEEFCGILIANDIEKIEKSLENARKTIENLGIEHPKSPAGVLTASFGVAIENSSNVTNFDQMYKIADLALYKAKENGRNRIEVTSNVIAL